MNADQKQRIDEIALRVHAATRGPWTHVNDGSGHQVHAPRHGIPRATVYDRRDAEFIAHVRSDIEFLLDLVERAQLPVLVLEMLRDVVGHFSNKDADEQVRAIDKMMRERDPTHPPLNRPLIAVRMLHDLFFNAAGHANAADLAPLFLATAEHLGNIGSEPLAKIEDTDRPPSRKGAVDVKVFDRRGSCTGLDVLDALVRLRDAGKIRTPYLPGMVIIGRPVAAADFRWRAIEDSDRRVAPGGVLWCFISGRGGHVTLAEPGQEPRVGSGLLLDLDDPCTVMAILTLIREATGNPTLAPISAEAIEEVRGIVPGRGVEWLLDGTGLPAGYVSDTEAQVVAMAAVALGAGVPRG